MRALFVPLVILCALLLAAPASADDIPGLQGQITDRSSAQVLSRDAARIQAVLDELLRSDDIQLFVLFVESTSGRTVTDFADETARVNSLGANDALMVVALTDRTDALWRSDDYLDRLTDRELETVLAQQIEPRLRDGDYAGAVIAGAEGIRAAARGDGTVPVPVTPSGAPNVGYVLPIVLIVAGAALLWLVISTRRREAATAAARARKDAERAQEANALLIRADESLRDAQEEMGYAEAQFTPADVAPYRAAAATAATELKAAFTARQQLDDAVPEDPDTRRRLVEDVHARATKALSLLDEQRRRVAEMRELERRAPELLAELLDQIEAASARLPEAERTVAGFARYAEQSWSSVKSNAVDARDLLGRAGAHVVDGETALKGSDAAAAAKAVREAQQDLAEAARLIDSIGAVAKAIAAAESTAREHIAAAKSDIERAATALARGATGEQQSRFDTARTALAAAEAAVAAARPDYVASVRLATEADRDADAILAELKQQAEREEREARLAATQLQVAQDAYRRASDYVSPRRRAIGATARTRLAEAERHIDRARQLNDAGDRAGAATEAQRAQRLADEAWSLAREDLREAESAGPWTGFPRGGPVIIPFPFPFPTGGGSGRSVGSGWRPPISLPRPGGRSVGGRW